jgi:DNA-binding XRE family transcriptional regulator
MPRKSFDELRAELDRKPAAKTRREKARRQLQDQIEAYEATLREIRRAQALTQEQLANALGVSQAQVSRIESQADLYLSTLESYLAAMGGALELVAVFGDRRVTLELGELASPHPPTTAKPGSRKRTDPETHTGKRGGAKAGSTVKKPSGAGRRVAKSS